MQNCSSNLVKPGKTAHLHRKMAIRNRLMLMTKFPVCSYNRKKAKVLTLDLVPAIVDSRKMKSFSEKKTKFLADISFHFRPFVFR